VVDWRTGGDCQRIAATYLPALEQNEPDLVEEMKGIAAGAGDDFLDMLALNLRSFVDGLFGRVHFDCDSYNGL
jgi:hypothetical protein